MSSLKILLDEMYAGLKEYLEALGWTVFTVHDFGLGGAKDREVVEYARDHGYLLVTQDQKQAKLAELLGIKYFFISFAVIAKMVDKEIKEKYPDLDE